MGGAEQILIDLLRGLREVRPDWHLHLLTGAAGPLHTRVAALGIACHVVLMPARISGLGDAGAGGASGQNTDGIGLSGRLAVCATILPSYIIRLRRELAEIGPDIVQTNGFKMHLLGCWAARQRTPVLWHVHDFVSSRPVMAPMLRLHARRCTAACAVSNAVLRDLRKVCGQDLNVWQVRNGIDLNDFSPSGLGANLDELARMATAPSGTVRVGLIATMALWKGHRIFLRAIAQIPRDLPFRAYVIGGPIYRTARSQESISILRAFAAELGVADRVGFTGFVAESAAVMRGLDVVVHASSEPEPFGLVIAQAMACGRAVIATRTAGAAETIQFGEDALEHSSGDYDSLGRTIQMLIESPERRRLLSEQARQTACLKFNRERMVAEMMRVYAEVVPSEIAAVRAFQDCGEVHS